MRFTEDQLHRQSNNFDLLRLLAAILVMLGHAPLILTGKHFDFDYCEWLFHHATHSFGLVLFFVISGFLVSASWEKRSSLLPFFKARFLRIYPGLLILTLLSVFVFGPFLSTFSFMDYFQNSLTWKYAFNATLIRISHFLPGVFEQNPLHGVNGSLWSLPYEFFCYSLVPLIALFPSGFKKRGGIVLFVIVLVLLYFFWEKQVNALTIPLLKLNLGVSAHYFLYFLSGAAYYHLREKLIWKWWMAALVIGLSLLWPYTGLSDHWLVLSLPYLVLYAAMGLPRIKINLQAFGDLSYGICLYAFPVQQTLVYFFPDLSFTVFLFASLLVTTFLAWMSWRFIEAPALKMKF